MARVIALAALLTVVSTTGLARANELEDVAAEAGVDAVLLEGAVNTTGLAPRTYLTAVGEARDVRVPAAPTAPANSRVDCVIWYESRGVPTAVNPRSGASGLGQFLPSTWRTTPQGKAGYSVFNAAANREAVAWMLAVGRGREFEVITRGLC